MAEEVEKKRQKSREYPGISLEKAIEFVKTLKGYPMNKPLSYAAAATEFKVSPNTRSFKYALSAARQFGLINTNGETITFLDAAKKLVFPGDDMAAIKKLKMDCFTAPRLYGELLDSYRGKPLPVVKTLENVLVTGYGIAPNAANIAAQAFIDTANEVGAIKGGILDLEIIADKAEVGELELEKTVSRPVISNEVPKRNEEKTENDTIEGFDSPLTIPFGNKRKAILYMPIDTKKADAEYAMMMILSMFRQLYGIDKG